MVEFEGEIEVDDDEEESESDVITEWIACPRCGRNLYGARWHGVCPRCRASVHAMLGPRSVDDAFCIQCGYALRGLDAKGACPECGTAIERSLRGDLLQFCSLDYVRSLRRGAQLVLASIKIRFVFGLANVAAGLAGLSGSGTVVDSLVGIICRLAVFVSLVGWWMLTEEDPSYRGRDEGRAVRRMVRYALMLTGAFQLVDLINPSLIAMPLNFSLGIMNASWDLGAVATMAIQFFPSMLYVSWLAVRLPNFRVYQRARRLLWLAPLLITVGSVILGIGYLIAATMYLQMFSWINADLQRIEKKVATERLA